MKKNALKLPVIVILTSLTFFVACKKDEGASDEFVVFFLDMVR
ncbi:MAG: hypothetical protein U9R60_09750 [Bacteroidota bacterium]|nr:hypothetical protein [Bacteroidota bacterium]